MKKFMSTSGELPFACLFPLQYLATHSVSPQLQSLGKLLVYCSKIKHMTTKGIIKQMALYLLPNDCLWKELVTF